MPLIPTAMNASHVSQEKYGAVLIRGSPQAIMLAPFLSKRSSLTQGDTSPGNDAQLHTGARKIRVGFLSKFFTMEHAHGELLKVSFRLLSAHQLRCYNARISIDADNVVASRMCAIVRWFRVWSFAKPARIPVC